MWPLAGIYSLDSIRLNYGDATTQLKVSPNIGVSTLHTYPGPGNYYACIIRYISSLGNPGVPIPCTYCDSIIIPASNNCFVNAGYTNTVSGNTASFTNTSTCAVCTSISYSWDFGDGSPLSNAVSPTHTYAASGTYAVCLIATGVNPNAVTCSDTICMNITISASIPCTSLASYSYILSALTANFTNTGTCTNCTSTSYAWDFGDGSPISNAISPSHTYSTSGTYTVCLTQTGVDNQLNTCVDDTCMVITVPPAGNPCLATANFSAAVSGLTANFTNSSTCSNCNTTSYTWDFGDGQTSGLTSPSHTYTTGGSYNVCVYVNGNSSNLQTCSDTMCKVVVVNASGVTDYQTGTLHLFPNPASGQVTLDIPGSDKSGELVIQDLTGRIMRRQSLTPGASSLLLDIKFLSMGNYILRVHTSTGYYKALLSVNN